MRSPLLKTLWASALAATLGPASAATLVATYDFDNTLNATSGTAPALVAINPLGQNAFESAVVHGQTQTVYHWSGDGSTPTLNAGFSVDTTGLLSYENYSVEMTFEFLTGPAFGNGWRRIIDTQNRQSDNGFYVDPENTLQVYPVVSGSTVFTTPGFHDVVLTNFVVNGTREVKAYLDGNLELVSDTDQLNLNGANNPGHLLNFFVDNLAGPAQQEFADGRIATLRLYDGIITPSVPEPQSLALMLAGLLAVGAVTRRKTH